jgi:hypothetical protein
MRTVRDIARSRFPNERMTHYVEAIGFCIDKFYDLDGLMQLCREHNTDVDNIVNVIAAKRLDIDLEDVEDALEKEKHR